MDIIYFLLKHTPFWAIPTIMISTEFGFIYWHKAYKGTFFFLVLLAFFSLVALVFYFWAGGPERSVQQFMEICNIFKEY